MSDEVQRYRSGVVAKMLQMPVATLRVWERRYQISRGALTSSGQRLYSAEDVQRLTVLKRLTELGHSIGRLAALEMSQLLEMAATHDLAQQGNWKPAGAAAAPCSTTWRIAVIGRSLMRRFQRPDLTKHFQRPVELLGPFDDGLQAGRALRGVQVDVLLIHEPALQADWLDQLVRAAPELKAGPKAVLYGFASDKTCESLTEAGVGLLREPQSDAVLAQWLQNMLLARCSAPHQSPQHDGSNLTESAVVSAPVARRWSEADLIDFRDRSFAINCECPRHLTELVVQLCHFEDYSTQCADQDTTNSRVHHHLRRVASETRAQLEQALIYVAQIEGIPLPPQVAHTARE